MAGLSVAAALSWSFVQTSGAAEKSGGDEKDILLFAGCGPRPEK
jgi:hypothetical protein